MQHDHSASPLPREALPALRLLVRAAVYAEDAGGDPWQFAVALKELRAAGLSRNDVRWLLSKSLAAQAHETTVPGDPVRSFRPLAPTATTSAACLQLTPAGVARLKPILETAAAAASLPQPPAEPRPRPADPALDLPEWDADRRELRYRGAIVKRFRVPAANQELLLTAFQEDGWPHHIDDPLPPEPDIEPKRRLLATVKSLNRSQIAPLLRFHGNGNGLQVFWEPTQRPCRATKRSHPDSAAP